LLAKYGDLCEDAVILHGSRELLELVKEQRAKNPCLRIADLAISGGELKELGFEPRRIGEIMGYLLDLVIDEPRLNDKNMLVSIASDKAAE
jgi:tRNA nucleotidyltransferase (CCA-adding enzyme)